NLGALRLAVSRQPEVAAISLSDRGADLDPLGRAGWFCLRSSWKSLPRRNREIRAGGAARLRSSAACRNSRGMRAGDVEIFEKRFRLRYLILASYINCPFATV